MKEASGNLYKKKRKLGLCVFLGCKNSAIKSKKYCCKCQRRVLKERHPITYWYDILRSNVRRRKIRFAITIDEFKKFCDENNYLELKGRGAGKATIDRKKSDPKIGYTYENIQILEHASNSRKVHIDRKLKQMYDSGKSPSQEEIDAFKDQLTAFGNEFELYKPETKDYDF